LLSDTTLLHSHDEYFRARLPIRLGLVRLDVGPSAVVYLGDDVEALPRRVRVQARLDKSGRGVLVAGSDQLRRVDRASFRSAHLREMSCDPRGRRVLVADGGSALGMALVRAMVDAGADVVWVGCGPEVAQPGRLGDLPGGFKQVRVVSMDAMSDESVNALAAQIGSEVDVLINNAGLPAQALGRAMRATSAMAPVGSPLLAWVNVLAVDSYAQSLRAEMRPAGIRVVNVFPPPPNLAPDVLARAVVNALQEGIEDLHPGELPQDWFARWCNNPGLPECGPATEREPATDR
jgi:hypothetical protein